MYKELIERLNDGETCMDAVDEAIGVIEKQAAALAAKDALLAEARDRMSVIRAISMSSPAYGWIWTREDEDMLKKLEGKE